MASASMMRVLPPGQRLPEGEVRRQHQLFAENKILRDVLDGVPTASTILNMRRQIVLGNSAAVRLAGLPNEEAMLGMRPGESVGCVHAEESEGGCGTTEFCSTCGAAQAIFAGENGQKNSKECRMFRKGADGQHEAVELMVSVEPFSVGDESFLNCSMVDMSHERRRRMLERSFFHDVLNSAAGLILSVDCIHESTPPDAIVEYTSLIRTCSNQIVSEIRSHQNLLAAESGELKLNLSWFNTQDMVTLFFEQYQQQFLQRRCALRMDDACEEIVVRSDQALLGRVLGNMLKNALEAATIGSTVTLGARKVGEEFEIWVQNPQFMPLDVQHQIFHRSFSTKGSGRGLGTYGMRLLSERYLHGTVGFSSDEVNGTTFWGRYPIDPAR